MTEERYSPLEPHEVQAAIQRHISSTLRSRSWEVFPQKADGLYHGKATEEGFDLSLAAGSERGNSLLEITGLVLPVPHGQPGCLIKLEYRPGRTNQVVWAVMLLFLLIFLGLVLANYQATGKLSAIVMLPALGLFGLLAFAVIYRTEAAKARQFLAVLLQLRQRISEV